MDHSADRQLRLDISHYLENTTRIFPHFSEPKIRGRLKFKVLFSTLHKPQEHYFPRRTSGLAKGAEYFEDSEMYLPPKTVDSHKKFLNVKRPTPCYTIRADCKVNKCLERRA